MPRTKSTAKKTSTTKATKKTTKRAVKKTTKKAAAKTTKKAKVKKENTKKPLVQAADHASFWMTDGQILATLIELHDALGEMERTVYEYHAYGDQNDFACWVCDVLLDADCAKDLKKAKTPRSAKTTVSRHLKLYTY